MIRSHPPHHAGPIVNLHPAYRKGTTMSATAAALLRTALTDAPVGLYVAPDGDGLPAVWRGESGMVHVLGLRDVRTGVSIEADADVIRLLGLLLAAAPHLAAMLNATERDDLTDEQVMVATLDALDKVREAITEVGES